MGVLVAADRVGSKEAVMDGRDAEPLPPAPQAPNKTSEAKETKLNAARCASPLGMEDLFRHGSVHRRLERPS